jgi:rhodanese-related sulfurtransferase
LEKKPSQTTPLARAHSTHLSENNSGDSTHGGEVNVAQIKSVSPEEAAELMKSGHAYVDVRSEPEFEQGHPEGALNVPIAHAGPAGMTPNAEFLDVMQAAFSKSEPLIVGCKAGGRSRRAAETLVAAGFSNIVDQSAGFDGGRDAFGAALPGWSKKPLPVGTGKPKGQAYEDVRERKPKP